MTIAVTGSSGFLGRNLIDYLLRSGIETVAGYRTGGSSSGLKLVNLTETTLDYQNPQKLFDFCSGAKTLFHLAGPDAETCATRPEVIEVYLQETRQLFLAAADAGVSEFVYVSTAHIYGESLEDRFAESSVCNPTTEYGRSRLVVENMLQALATLKGVELIILRLSNCFGWDDQESSSGWKLFTNNVSRSAVRSGTIRILGNPHTVRDFVYVGDVLEMLGKIASSSREPLGGVWNIGSGDGLELIQIAELVVQSVHKEAGSRPIIQVVHGNTEHESVLRIDVTKARKHGLLLPSSPARGIDLLVRKLLEEFEREAR